MGKYKKLGKNIGLITVGNFASKMLSFFLIPLYTAILTTEEYGIADLMTTTVQLISPFFTLVISESVMRFALDQEKDPRQVLSAGLTVLLSGFVIMCAFSPLLLLNHDLAPYYGLFLLYYLAVTLHSIVSQFVKGIEHVFIYSLCGVLQTAAFIFLNVLFLVVLGIGVYGYLLSLILSNFVAVIVLFCGVKGWKYIVPLKSLDKTLLREMLRYSIPMVPNSLSWWISNSSDKYMLTAFVGVAATGVYSVAQRIPSLFAVISSIFIGAWQISAIEDFGSDASRAFYSDIYQKYSSLCIILVSVLICFSKWIGAILFSKSFFEGWIYVPLLVFAFLFQAMSGYLGTIYTSAKKTKMLFVSTVIAAAANIVLNAVLIPIIGIQGAAIATFASYFLIWAIRLYDSRKILHLDIHFKSDFLSYLLIMVQIILMIRNTSQSMAAAFILLAFVLLLNRSIIRVVIQTAAGMLRKN